MDKYQKKLRDELAEARYCQYRADVDQHKIYRDGYNDAMEQVNILENALQDIAGYWGACGDDAEHPSGLGLFEFSREALAKFRGQSGADRGLDE